MVPRSNFAPHERDSTLPTTLSQIDQFYAAVDYAPPPALDAGTLAHYETLDPTAVLSAIEAEPYTQNVVDPIIREYQAAFNRAPDPSGGAFWTHQLGGGGVSVSQLSTVFANSPEFGGFYGGATATTPANMTLVTAMYVNVLARVPDAAGLAFWTSQGLNAAQLLQDFSQSTEFVQFIEPHIIAFQNTTAAGGEWQGSLLRLGGPVQPAPLVGVHDAPIT